MRQLTTDHLSKILADHGPPCISIYQPTHRLRPDNLQDPIRYRNLLSAVEESLRRQYPAREIQALLTPFQQLANDEEFWRLRTEGLAILGAPGVFQIFELQRPVKETVTVADSFHVKPLLRILQSADRFQILSLNRHRVKLYEGNRDAIDPVELTSIPTTITEALGNELTEPHQTVASYGMEGGSGKAMFHGHGSANEEVDIDMERFFRVVDRNILEHHSRPSGLPLMLAALKEYHGPFRQISRNPLLMKESLQVNPEALNLEQLRLQAWKKIEPLYLQRLAELVATYELALSRQMGTDDIEEVAAAAAAGRVGSLLVDADREVAGSVDPETGQVTFSAPGQPATGDILDDLAELVFRKKGAVVVVPNNRMPTATGVAATYRY
ncbi:baeRF3 domain-containing protein [Desulfobulbus alkaliphilus]|uniref:baeRF3 domain-containing protein n=1 Tax=Desulfobulbus alkaliphilus TaxID=869814 RepID=UPI001966AEC9|nr:hypothetical protein [Desulfobulbus alkaliphilus]MBM9537566.1 hypothetical protein [Desulfobulbus alkaliphilus]